MSVYDSNYSTTGVFDPNSFLKGAQASMALDKMRAQNLASMQATGGDNASAVSTLNNAGLYQDASSQASTPYTQQYADNAATSNNVALQGQQQNLAAQQQTAQDAAQAKEAQQALQVTTYLSNIRDTQGADKVPMAFNQMLPFLQQQMGMKPEDLTSIQQQLATNPGFLDAIHGQAKDAVAKLNLHTDNSGNMWNVKTDANGNPVAQQVQALGPDGKPIVSPAPGTTPPAAQGAPVPAQSGLTHAAMVALAEDAQHPEAVLSVMMNRARQTGGNLDQVLQAPHQFESVANGSANKIAPTQVQALLARPDIQQILHGNIPQQFQGLTNFYNPALNAQLAQKDGRPAVPSWASDPNNPGVQIGQQMYFKGGPTGLPSSGGDSPIVAPNFNKPAKAPNVPGGGGVPTDPATLQFYASQVNAGVPVGQFVRGRGAQGQAELDAITAAGRQQYGPAWNPMTAASTLKANQTSLGQLNAKANALGTFEQTIQNNMGVLTGLLDKGVGAPNLGPLTGLYIQGKMAAHDPQYNALIAAAQNVGTEYGKYQSGGTGMAAAPEGAREAANTLINAQQKSAAEIRAALGVIQQDMAGQKTAYTNGVARLKGQIANPGAAGDVPQQAPSTSETAAQTLARLRHQYGNK